MKSILALCVVAAVFVYADFARAKVASPTKVSALDVPDDGGGAIEVRWDGSASAEIARFEILREERGGAKAGVGEVPAIETSFTDSGGRATAPEDGTEYRYIVRAVGHDGSEVDSAPTPWVRPRASWIHTARLVNLALVVLFVAVFAVLVLRGRRGEALYVRPIDALDALEDAVGRAAEMGRPVFYAPGLNSVTAPSTVASMSLLGRVGEVAAGLHTKVKVPNFDPLTWPVAREVVRQAFAKAGRPEEYDPDDITYLTSRSFTYAAAAAGIMARERTASNFLIGHFYSESLILAETGVATGAMQIGGTDSVAQLPFFITTCDKTMIGEELFAAAAVVGDDPVGRSTVKAHDWFKVILMAAIAAGIVAGVLYDAGLLERLLASLGVDDAGGAAAAFARALRGGAQ